MILNITFSKIYVGNIPSSLDNIFTFNFSDIFIPKSEVPPTNNIYF